MEEDARAALAPRVWSAVEAAAVAGAAVDRGRVAARFGAPPDGGPLNGGPRDGGPLDGDAATAIDLAWGLGPAREALLEDTARRAAGAWFTPPDLCRHLVELARPTAAPRRVVDPACGGGALLLAAGEAHPGAVLVGVDVDPVTADVCATALELAGHAGHEVRAGDGLLVPRPVRPADLVVGNPPFRSPLRATTARTDGRRAALRERFGAPASGFVDEAALFLLAVATEHLAPGGVAVLLLPEAVLATADAAPVRRAVEAVCDVEVVWRDDGGAVPTAFPHTPTCAMRLVRRVEGAASAGERPADDGSAGHRRAGRWGPLLARATPEVNLPEDGPTVADLATATADFRDAHYLLADHVVEAPPARPPEDDEQPLRRTTASPPRLVTVGMLDPAHLRWGEAEVRFAKRRWRRPVVPGVPADFAGPRLGPKLLVATQSRVLEVVVDDAGDLLPSTPVITVRTDRPWHVAAALTSPVATAVAARRHAGAARSRDAIKLSARQVLDLPLPPGPSTAWDDAAAALRRAHAVRDAEARHVLLLRCGHAVMAAHGIDDDALLAWWADRLPRR